jgi:hypothetical protein
MDPSDFSSNNNSEFCDDNSANGEPDVNQCNQTLKPTWRRDVILNDTQFDDIQHNDLLTNSIE